MRIEQITYDDFCHAVQQMHRTGEKVTVRTVLSHTGGSFSKVADYLKRWREEQTKAQVSQEQDISTHLKQAMLAEISNAVAECKQQLENQLAQAHTDLDEAHVTLSRQEQMLDAAAQQIDQLRQQEAVLNQMQTEQRERIQQLEHKLEQTIEAKHAADKQAAIAQTRCTELEKQLLQKDKTEQVVL